MQKSQNILHYKGIGEVYFTRSSRAKNLSIRINQQGEVRVTRPRFVSQKRAEMFFYSKQQWVIKKLDEAGGADCRDSLPVEGHTIRIMGRDYPVSKKKSDDSMEAAIWRILKEEANRYLPARVEALSKEHGFVVSGVKVRKMKTRWGSCTARKSINLNSWLVMIPHHLSDYVILHELVHTRIPDHSSKFWDELDRVMEGESKKCRKELRNFRIMCFPVVQAD